MPDSSIITLQKIYIYIYHFRVAVKHVAAATCKDFLRSQGGPTSPQKLTGIPARQGVLLYLEARAVQRPLVDSVPRQRPCSGASRPMRQESELHLVLKLCRTLSRSRQALRGAWQLCLRRFAGAACAGDGSHKLQGARTLRIRRL